MEPRHHHPAFYGSYDWHSAVQTRTGCWSGCCAAAPTASAPTRSPPYWTGTLTWPNALAAEADYLRAHPSFERPYGWAWLLALTAECGSLPGAAGERWAKALEPAADAVRALLGGWLARATYPVRHGVHTNSAFALGLVLDSAAAAGVTTIVEPVTEAVLGWFADDRDAPVHWEPSGQDFLSPALTEAEAMSRVLPEEEFARWLERFLPGVEWARPSPCSPRPSSPTPPIRRSVISSASSSAGPPRSAAWPPPCRTAIHGWTYCGRRPATIWPPGSRPPTPGTSPAITCWPPSRRSPWTDHRPVSRRLTDR
ncbi:hypothetical protein SANTM175S_01138 [Streptomyces antimycoticus]